LISPALILPALIVTLCIKPGSLVVVHTLVLKSFHSWRADACQNEDYEAAEKIVVYLIQKHNVLLRMFDDDHWTALHHAARCSSAKICEILIDNECDVDGRAKTLNTPLIECCERTDEEALQVAKILIERGADLAKKSERGNTALHWACLYGRVDMVQFLIDAEADFNSSR
jgi:ankyrin repeat protein